jgi:hypothetical protein
MNPEGRQRTTGSQPPRVLAAILRMDLKASSAVAENDIVAFDSFMDLLREQVKEELYPSLIGIDEGEGDSIRRAFTDVRDALLCAFSLRHAAQQPLDTMNGLYILKSRIVLHFGEFLRSGSGRITGAGQILVTRLDQAVPPGEVWATEAFFDVTRHIQADNRYNFEYEGQHELDKGAGRHPCYAVTPVGAASSPRSSRRHYDPVELAWGLFEGGDQSSQLSAVEVLATFDSEAASRHLLEIALNPEVDRRVRHTALVKLQDRGDDVDVGTIEHELQNKAAPVETRALLLLVLGATGDKGAFRTLSGVLNAEEPREDNRLREAALLAMRGLEGPVVKRAVEAALNDTEDVVRIAACVAAASGRMPSSVQQRLHDIVKDGDSPLDVRYVACEALASQALNNSLSRRLEELVLDRTLPLTLRRYALDGLAPSDDPLSVRAVEEVARRTDDLQVEAIAALSAMRAPRSLARRRAQQPASYLAEVIQLRTRPQPGGAQTPAR